MKHKFGVESENVKAPPPVFGDITCPGRHGVCTRLRAGAWLERLSASSDERLARGDQEQPFKTGGL